MSDDALALAAAASGTYLERLRGLVALDGPSGDGEALGAAAGVWAELCRGAGLAVERLPVSGSDGTPLGDVVVARRRRAGGRGRVLLTGHLDTVYPRGTAAARGLTVTGDRAVGPGVCDDRGGLLAGLAAVELLDALDRDGPAELLLVATPDEELGAPGSGRVLKELGAWADVALSLECARPDGALVNARRGARDLHVELRGRAAHAGIEPDAGADAALAAAQLTVALHGLRGPGVSLNVGVLRAGERPNVIADRAELGVDLRADTGVQLDALLAEAVALTRQARGGVRAEVSVGAVVAPWAGGPGTEALVDLAREVGDGLGVEVVARPTGGCADANLLAATGTPVLDGLGPIGGGDHSPGEWLDLTSVPSRVALLAGVVERCVARVGAPAAPLG